MTLDDVKLVICLPSEMACNLHNSYQLVQVSLLFSSE